MHVIKQSFALLAVLALLFATSCQPATDDCTPPALGTNIIGKWSAAWKTNATIEFKSNGTLSDPSDAIVGGEINGQALTVKTYEINGDSLKVRAEAPNNPAQALTANVKVSENQCDRITLEILGIGVHMNRQ